MINGASHAVTSQLLPDNTTLNAGTEEELRCYGYEDNKRKRILFYVLVVMSFGLVLLLMYWRPDLECYLKKSRCTLHRADTVLLQDQFGRNNVCCIKSLNLADELHEFNDAYNREESAPENVIDVSDVANLTVKQMEPVVLYFDHQHVRYLWSNQDKSYSKLLDLSTNTRLPILEQYKGLSPRQQAHRRMLYGTNSIDVEVKSYWKLLIEEVLNPFYIFQIFSIVLWATDQYYVYASCILVISTISIIISLYQTKKQMITLHNMVKVDAMMITVARGDGFFENVHVMDLVPGDVIVIPPKGCVMTCDAVLLGGTVIVNESMLTGESLPVTKTSIVVGETSEIYSPQNHKRSTIFAGTRVIQTRYYEGSKVLAVVVRTGFSTAKGELVRGILYPKPLGFKFYRDAFHFVMFLGAVALFGMAYSIYTHIVYLHASPERIILRVLDVVTIIVPPALPAAMTVGTVYAQSRLKKKQIFCISPPRINFCGRLNLFCFDKTGTLTEDGMDLGKVLPAKNGSFLHSVSDPSHLEREELLIGMATCHSLTIIDGEISGDPMDVIMFNSTKWTLEEPGKDTSKFDNIMPTIVKPATRDTFLTEEDLGEASQFEVGIVRQFTFSNYLKCMSVITRTLGKGNMAVFSKGAPEKIVQLCHKETVPDDLHTVMNQYCLQGFRVLGLAWKQLDHKVSWHQAQRMSREEAESELTFIGLLIFQNKLKIQSKPVIRTLLRANVRCCMITGDRSDTAICVGRNCGMIEPRDHIVLVKASKPENGSGPKIVWEPLEQTSSENAHMSSDNELVGSLFTNVKFNAATQATTAVPMTEPKTHLAIDGSSFAVLEKYFPETLRKVCIRGTIFARMSPDQKCQLIQKQQELGYSVGMCGDGANDCEALKAAHAGISLSEAEASVAAPFTSAVNNIECVVTLMREGRAALVTSFGCFKYMAVYSFIQFISVMILYTFEYNLADWQFLYIDLLITTTVAILMGYTTAYEQLVAERPEGSLIKPSNILSILLHVLAAAVFQSAAVVYLSAQKWYTYEGPVKEGQTKSWVSTVVFVVSSYQYITAAFCFSKGPPFRKRIYTNAPYLISLVFLVVFSTCIFLIPIQFLEKVLLMEPLENHSLKFRGLLLAIVAGHFVTSVLIEYLVSENMCVRACIKGCVNRIQAKKTKSAYKLLEKEIEATNWPPIGLESFSDAGADAGLTMEDGNSGSFQLSVSR